ncbi:MAG TPA: hypothetical protein VMR97_13105 [Acidimicrobiales bacterium]|nr:hypothetical protein [Acidimicrobiales bacterium]
MLECVVNVSEGRDVATIGSIAAAGADHVLDLHSDPDHHRSVITLGGAFTEDAVREVAKRTVELLDIRVHTGAHPRIGVLDVVPFVPLAPSGAPIPYGGALGPALAARDRFAEWAGGALELPCFCYGPERTLPEIRRTAFSDLEPDTGPSRPHPSAGACAVGARYALVAYNLWLSTSELSTAGALAVQLRGPTVRAIGVAVGSATQVSCNLLEPASFGPAEAYDSVARLAAGLGIEITKAELVGLAPAEVVEATAPERRRQLDLEPERTIERRLAAAGAL